MVLGAGIQVDEDQGGVEELTGGLARAEEGRRRGDAMMPSSAVAMAGRSVRARAGVRLPFYSEQGEGREVGQGARH